MKNYMPGFAPINFKKSGKILLALGLICLAAKIISNLTGWFSLPNYSIYFGAALIALSLYLIFIVPKE